VRKLEKTIHFSETIEEINGIRDKLKKSAPLEADAVKQKSRSCFSKNKNKGLVMCEISCIFEGKDLVDSEDMKDLSVSDIVCYMYARPVSCDVERTFSPYKSLSLDNRHRFTVHDFKMAFVVRCNTASLSV
jgi:hypothetical protein